MVDPFRLAWPSWRPPPGDGVVAVVSGPDAAGGWVEALLARDGERSVVWTATGTPEVSGVEVVGRTGVVAATVARAGVDTRLVGLALELACRLVEQRAAAGGDAGGCLTSWSAPVVPGGMLRVPHLVTVSRDGQVSDAVVWEVLAPEAVERWLGCRAGEGDLAFVEANLEALVRLRAAVRDGRLPATAARRQVAEPPAGPGRVDDRVGLSASRAVPGVAVMNGVSLWSLVVGWVAGPGS